MMPDTGPRGGGKQIPPGNVKEPDGDGSLIAAMLLTSTVTSTPASAASNPSPVVRSTPAARANTTDSCPAAANASTT